MDDALLAKTVAIADLNERLTFYAGSRRPGLPRIRPLVLERLDDGWTPPESELEALLFAVLDRRPSRPMIDPPGSVAVASVAYRAASTS